MEDMKSQRKVNYGEILVQGQRKGLEEKHLVQEITTYNRHLMPVLW